MAGIVAACGIFQAGCGGDRVKTDAELGLTPQQSAGRAIFDHYCSACHNAYSSSGSKGPGLKNLFGKQYLPSGLPANDRFAEDTITGGRKMMPPFGDSLTSDQLESLMAYLHTL